MAICGNVPLCKWPPLPSPNAKQAPQVFQREPLGESDKNQWIFAQRRICRHLFPDPEKQGITWGPSSESLALFLELSNEQLASHLHRQWPTLSGGLCLFFWNLEEPFECLPFRSKLIRPPPTRCSKLATRSLLSPGLAQPTGDSRKLDPEEETELLPTSKH